MATVTLEMPESQVIELVKKLSPATKQTVLEMLIKDRGRWEVLTDYGHERMQQICAERGIDWDSLSEEEAEQLIDDMLHQR